LSRASFFRASLMFVGQGDLKNWTSLKRLDRDEVFLY
jgi:hypothetical protein